MEGGKFPSGYYIPNKHTHTQKDISNECREKIERSCHSWAASDIIIHRSFVISMVKWANSFEQTTGAAGRTKSRVWCIDPSSLSHWRLPPLFPPDPPISRFLRIPNGEDDVLFPSSCSHHWHSERMALSPYSIDNRLHLRKSSCVLHGL